MLVSVLISASVDLVPWIYSVKGFLISTVVVSTVVAFSKIQDAKNKREEYYKRFRQSPNLNRGAYTISCPVCEERISINVKNMPLKKHQKRLICRGCENEMTFSVPDEYYDCIGCKQKFNSVDKKVKHIKKCPKMRGRGFSCKFCKTQFYLNDNEFADYKAKGEIKVQCPKCKKEMATRKK